MKAKAYVYLSAMTLLLMLIVALGCSKAPNDNQIASDIQAKLTSDSGLQGKQLVVQAANGTVTLSGTVDNSAQRDAAARYASSEEGVKQVVNNLQVASSGKEMQMAPPRPARQEVTSRESSKRAASKPRRHEPQKADEDTNSDQDRQSVAQVQPPAPQPAPVAPPAPATPPPPPPQKVTIPSGMALSVRLVDSIDSEKNQTGDTIHATLNTPITIDGDVVVPSGSEVTGHLAEVRSAGRFAGKSLVLLQLDSISSGGKTYNIQTDQYKREGSSRGVNTAEKVGAGAGIGAIIGAIAGGGKGAAIGAAAGGGLGGGVQAATKGQQIKLPSETVLNFNLQAPVTVVASERNPNSDRQKLGPN